MDGVRGGGLVRDSRGVGDLLEWGVPRWVLSLVALPWPSPRKHALGAVQKQ